MHYSFPSGYYDRMWSLVDDSPNTRGIGLGSGSNLLTATDGTSQTIMLGESAGAPFSYYRRIRIPPTSPDESWSIESGLTGGPWAAFREGDWATWSYDPNFFNQDEWGNVERYVTWGGTQCVQNCTNVYDNPHSFHTGGINYAMADGSIRFIRDSIDHDNFRRLVFKDDGEVITADY